MLRSTEASFADRINTATRRIPAWPLYLLAVLPPDAKEGDDIYLLNVSPLALRSLDNYVAQLEAMHNLPPVAFLTELTIAPAGGSVTVNFGNARPNPNVAAHMPRIKEARAMLERIPDFFISGNDAAAPAAAPKPKRGRRKAA